MDGEEALDNILNCVRQREWAWLEEWQCPCVDCGRVTGGWCDGVMIAEGELVACSAAHWMSGFALGSWRGTPLCSTCDAHVGICYFCRGQSWATPPKKTMSRVMSMRRKFVGDVQDYLGDGAEQWLPRDYLYSLSGSVPPYRLSGLLKEVIRVHMEARNLEECKRLIESAVLIINAQTENAHELFAGELPPEYWE